MPQPQAIYLKDYQAPSYIVPEVDLVFHLGEKETLVENTMWIEKNPAGNGPNSLHLDGEQLQLVSIELDGTPLKDSTYRITESSLTLSDLPERAKLKIVTKIFPQENKAFSGLYKTKTIFCTQMEAEGFRRVTFFQDRPDVLSKYTTTLYAPKDKYPNLLSNGEFVEGKDLAGGIHMSKWRDPFLKPCYLFALVAGDLDCIKDSFLTASNKKVDLAIYVDKGKGGRARHAMLSLKQSMKWDEETYGLEYDLNIYNIVAVDDFNMGAMENKSLNIFNSKYVLADLKSATDDEFSGILRVIGHEYFHNWSGNRVTCRDWFQLSLKEGLTVYRDQEFTCDLTSRAVKRIEDVDLLRTRQFPEDSGPMAHPVRPESYISIDNFYTVTVYMKGAEVIRMLQNIIGLDMFKKGLSFYFEKYDGQAVTTDDFVYAMEQVSGKDLGGFKNWYSQAGTPEILLSTHYDKDQQSLTLHWNQACKDPLSGKEHRPFHIPIRLGALGSNGSSMAFSLSPEGEKFEETLFELSEKEQSLTLYNLAEAPILSVFRNFSAPVKLNFEQSDESLYLLMTHDSDAVNRWDAGQKIYLKTLIQIYNALRSGNDASVPEPLIHALRTTLQNAMDQPALAAQLLRTPSAHYMTQFLEDVDPQFIAKSLDFFHHTVSKTLRSELSDLYTHIQKRNLGNSQDDIGLRSLKNTLLKILGANLEGQDSDFAFEQFSNAKNMTDRLASLMSLAHKNSKNSQKAFEEFYEEWKDDTLVINKWFSAQALSQKDGTFATIQDIAVNSVFDSTNPNNIYSLFNVFASENWKHFHLESGEAYKWFARQILDIDARNPQVASRLASVFNIRKKLAPTYRAPMTQALHEIHASKCSKNLYEIVDRALKS